MDLYDLLWNIATLFHKHPFAMTVISVKNGLLLALLEDPGPLLLGCFADLLFFVTVRGSLTQDRDYEDRLRHLFEWESQFIS